MNTTTEKTWTDEEKKVLRSMRDAFYMARQRCYNKNCPDYKYYGGLKARVNRLNYSIEDAFTKNVKCGEKLPTRQYAQRRKPDVSKIPRGINSPHTAFNIEQVHEIRRLVATGSRVSAVAETFCVCLNTIYDVINKAGGYRDVA